ncbi:phosphoribosylanthranilate isomerase [Sulfurirhabdus autotrophica]|uniref:N-(5'-phosphoribosyl)anthranilate isomerase n=1 Tax=Sulfurirhabdus autotrophica TaxID=1706046 RepID=A0A4R3YHK6_9PROT|nr:phosphoribosylanthranilate isomerase [Sulfurirhabdus autotrophica]TCV90474.1 phosphoribosylanthranilate isomerase [Sulfurirhabdus autotrophica]
MQTRVKICGITRVQDGLFASEVGADAIGLVFYPKSPRFVTSDQADTILRNLPPFITNVGLFVNPTSEDVLDIMGHVRLDLLQFHGEESPEFCEQFGLPYLKAVRVKPGIDLVQYALAYSNAKGLLLDAFVEGTHGGTGKSFDWSLIPDQLSLPVVLSGGLNAANVMAAIQHVRPWAVDVSSGVEASKGIKDAAQMAAFMKGVRDADV